MTAKIITSTQNQRIKDAARLRDRRHRDKQRRIVIDGARELLRAVAAGVQLTEIFVCPSLCESNESREAVGCLQGTDVTTWQVTPEVFDKLAFGKRHEGVLAVAQTPRRSIDELSVPANSLTAVLSGLEKPGNVGAILRCADGAGVAGVIAANAGTDLFNPNCIRASLGTVFTLRLCEATNDAALEWLRKRGTRILAARPDAARVYTEVDWRGDVALVLGSEAAGLDSLWQVADVTPIRLPMRGAADSLNVAATAAVLFYEALRQRR